MFELIKLLSHDKDTMHNFENSAHATSNMRMQQNEEEKLMMQISKLQDRNYKLINEIQTLRTEKAFAQHQTTGDSLRKQDISRLQQSLDTQIEENARLQEKIKMLQSSQCHGSQTKADRATPPAKTFVNQDSVRINDLETEVQTLQTVIAKQYAEQQQMYEDKKCADG